MGVEGAILVDVLYPLSLGIGRKDRCELAGLYTWKGFFAPQICWVGFGVSKVAESPH